jgi:hypothetical protein
MGVALLGTLQTAVLTVPALGGPFRVVPLTAAGWLLIFVAALTPVSLIEIAKIVRRRLRRPAA